LKNEREKKEKIRMEKLKRNSKREKVVIFGITSVNLKYNGIEQFVCSRIFQS
jgi:hypothetical protein